MNKTTGATAMGGMVSVTGQYHLSDDKSTTPRDYQIGRERDLFNTKTSLRTILKGPFQFSWEKGMWLLVVAKDSHLPLQLSRMQFLPVESSGFWFHYRTSEHIVEIIALELQDLEEGRYPSEVEKCDLEWSY